MKLRWKKHPRETGLAAVGANPNRSSSLHDGTDEFASVYPLGGSWNTGPMRGWYWVAFGQVPHCNTYNHTPYETEAEAKAAAMAYVKKHLSSAS